MPLDPLFKDRLHFWNDKSLTSREAAALFEAPLSEYVFKPMQVEDRSIDGPLGSIPVRIYKPINVTGALPALIWFHGGGFEFGDIDMNESDIVSREIVLRANALVLAVDYRLVTDEVKFPAPQLDGIASLQWLARNAKELGVDENKIFIGGISAGATLASAAAIMDRDMGDNYLAGQLLNCPMLHKQLPPYSSELAAKLEEQPDFLGLTPENLLKNNRHCVPNANLDDAEPWWFAGEVENLRGIAPAQITNCEYDTLRASGEEYGRQLAAAGVKVEVICQDSVPHAYINRYPADCKQTDQTLDLMARFISEVHK